MTDQHMEASYDVVEKIPKQKNDLGIEISEESADRLEVECGHCGKLFRIRSLAAHIMVAHPSQSK